MDSHELFQLIHQGQPLDEASREILALHLVQQTIDSLPNQDSQSNEYTWNNEDVIIHNQQQGTSSEAELLNHITLKKRKIISFMGETIQESMEEIQQLQIDLHAANLTVQKQNSELVSAHTRLNLVEKQLTATETKLKETENAFNTQIKTHNEASTTIREFLLGENGSLRNSNKICADHVKHVDTKLAQTSMKKIEYLDTINILVNHLTHNQPIPTNVLHYCRREVELHISNQILTSKTTATPNQNTVAAYTFCFDSGLYDTHPLQSFDHFAFAYKGPALGVEFIRTLGESRIRNVKLSTDSSTQTNYIAIRMFNTRVCSIQDVFDVTKQLINPATHNLSLVQPLTGDIVIFNPNGLISNPIVSAIRNGSTTSWDKTKRIWKL